MKRSSGIFETVFDVLYLATGTILGLMLLATSGGQDRVSRLLAGVMALVLVVGDSFHLVPRICAIVTDDATSRLPALGRGKQVTSITMTVFYLLLWHIGLREYPVGNDRLWTAALYGLATVRILLCLSPRNRWLESHPPRNWAILRNLPFILQGLMVAILFFHGRNALFGLRNMYLAILISFACYIPVVVWSNKNPKVGMLMLPKTCAYLWMLFMCLTL